MFTRRDICLLAGIEESQFKNLVRRDQFVTLHDPEHPAFQGGWGRFTALDALLVALQVRLMDQIGYADGLRPDTARKIVESGDLSGLGSSRSDYWIGYVGQPGKRGGRDGGANVAGTLADVAQRVNQLARQEAVPAERLFLINVSEVLRSVARRADAAKIPFSLSNAD